MKTPARHLIAAVVLLVCTTASALIAADAPKPNFRPLALELVGSYLAENKDDTDEAWTKYASEQKLGDKDLAQVCKETLSTARALIKAGTPVDSPFFARVLADSFLPPGTPTPKHTADNESKNTTATPTPATDSAATTQDEDTKNWENAVKVVAPLREYGFAFSAGAGAVLNNRDSATVQALFGRYNLRQKYATDLWNRRQRAEAAELEKSQKKKTKARQLAYSGAPSVAEADIGEYTKKVTFFGPVLGRTFAGETVTMDGREVRPWLVGLGVGFGLGPEGSSALYLDFCSTVSPHTGFAHAKPYVGLSFDGGVALKIFKFFGEPFGLGEK